MSEGSVTRAGTADDREMEPAVAAELLRLRGSIDNMDAALIHLLAERFKITQQVGHLKAEFGLPPADPAREAQQIARLRSLAIEAKLDPEFAEKFLTFVVAEVVRHHERFPDLKERFATFDLLTERIDRLCLNRNRLHMDGYRDRAQRPHAAVHGTVPNPLHAI